ncbi:MAG: acylneuraminate cytidylyltransferase family protein [Pontimonas sp.]|nr:acylneuraminate cytidylyltransferase family protein [Pontimonas sp.]
MTSHVALIPARGGSRELPGKNLLALNGFPLIAWSIRVALESGLFSKVLVSTDSERIAEVSEKFGATVEGLRPASLASDVATLDDVVFYELTKGSDLNSDRGQVVVVLQPTSPLRRLRDLAAVVDTIASGSAEIDSVISVGETHLHPSALRRIDGQLARPFFGGLELVKRRQDGDKGYAPTGAYFAINSERFLESRKIYADCVGFVVTPPHCNVDIDSALDLYVAEAVLSWEGSGDVFRLEQSSYRA